MATATTITQLIDKKLCTHLAILIQHLKLKENRALHKSFNGLKIENAKIKIRRESKNLGSFEAANVVQIYVHNLNSKSNSIVHPVKELKAFQKGMGKNAKKAKDIVIVPF